MQQKIWVVLSAGLVLSLGAFGDTTTNSQWTVSTTSGDYSYSGGLNPLVGTDLGITQVEGFDASDVSTTPSYTILDGELNFTSGAATGAWTWGSGGSLSVSGCLSANGTTCIAGENTSTTLLTDDFSSVQIINVAGVLEVAFGDLSGTMDSAAASLLGVSTSFVSPTGPNSYGFEDDVQGLPDFFHYGDAFSNVTPVSPGGTLNLVSVAVPENWSAASTLGLFGFASVIFALARRMGLLKSIAL